MLGQGYSQLELIRLGESDTKVYSEDQIETILAASIVNYCPPLEQRARRPPVSSGRNFVYTAHIPGIARPFVFSPPVRG